jgi:hypothetical protein
MPHLLMVLALLATYAATILLFIAPFGVPFIKSLYILKVTYNDAGFGVEFPGQSGSAIAGIYGFCMLIDVGEICPHSSVGYSDGV